jgi:UDP-N-acetylglucosamine--N-acetylmuramyl-(pentapeptide) pyrophosphoryl-undecaprenol N-acetylglucosamine transferase
VEELVNQKYSNLVWVGTKFSQTDSKNTSAEFNSVNSLGIHFIDFKAGKIWRKVTLKTLSKALLNFLLIPIGFIKAIGIITNEKPKLILSFGGFLALPIVIIGKLFGKKVITHEQTLTVGLANKLISKFANKILISFESSSKYFPKEKTVLTGLPIRNNIFEKGSDKIFFSNNKPIIYITGGNQGSNTINWRLFKILPRLLNNANVIHQVGGSTLTNDIIKAKETKGSLPKELQSNYLYFENTYDIIGEIFSKSDVILSRSGANTVYEILALGKLAVLIPIPWSSGQEQLLNAQLVAKTGLGFILNQYDEMPPEELFQSLNLALEMLNKKSDFFGRPIIEAVSESDLMQQNLS